MNCARLSVLTSWVVSFSATGIRVMSGVQTFLRWHDVTLARRGILGTNINTFSQRLHLPGTVLLIASIVTYFRHRMYKEEGAYVQAWGSPARPFWVRASR